MNWLDSVQSWLIKNDQNMNLATTWVLALGFYFLAGVEFRSWIAIRRARNRTVIGETMRGKKFSRFVLDAGIGTLYALTLYAFYDGYQFAFWERFIIRIVVIVGIVFAIWYGLRFMQALRKVDQES